MSTRAQVRFATREEGVSFSEHPDNVAMEIENTNIKHGDLEYIYYIWQKPDDTTWISIFEVNFGDTYCEECGSYLQPQHTKDKCIFVGEPQKLIEKYDRE